MKIIENTIASIMPQNENAAKDVNEIVTLHALGASSAAVASGAVPGVGEAIAVGIAMAFTCSMYYRVARRLGLNIKRNVLKAVASVVIAEIIAIFAVSMAAGVVLSFIPVGGTLGAMAVIATTDFLAVEAAGKMFLVILSKLFRAKTIAEIEAMSEAELRAYAKGCTTKDQLKAMLKEAKAEYKQVKDDKELRQRAQGIQPDEEPENEPDAMSA